jgi:hypothetical protein
MILNFFRLLLDILILIYLTVDFFNHTNYKKGKKTMQEDTIKERSEKEARERFGKYLSVPVLGMQFRRYKSANMTKLVATWRDELNSHVYEISVEPICDSPGWCATATNDNHVVFQLRTNNRTNCEHLALSAMKRYLKRGHHKTYRKIAKAKKEGK